MTVARRRDRVRHFVTGGCRYRPSSRPGNTAKARGDFVLKKLIGVGVAAAMLGAAPAEAQTICQHIGNGTFCDNGLSSQKICNTTFYSNGVLQQRRDASGYRQHLVL
jgi:hypothetical protein